MTESIREYLNKLLEKGFYIDKNTKLEYFSGYQYSTLYDWDFYFESVVLLHFKKGQKYIINGIKIFLANQEKSGFIPRLSIPVADKSSGEDACEHFKLPIKNRQNVLLKSIFLIRMSFGAIFLFQ